jgi:flagellar basal-body rod modification protein FlgD
MSASSVSSSSSSSAITTQSQYNTAYTQFLQMLTTELQNQDPTSPMDATQFTNQLVSFSQLEQQLQTNASLTTLVADQQSNALSSTLGYLGHNILASGDSVELDGKSASTIYYTLPSQASTATMTVTDSSGATVRTLAVPTAMGLNTVSFDGTEDGNAALPAGDYTYSIQATSSTGAAVSASTYTNGKVTAIDSSTGTTVLHLGNLLVNSSSVVEILS